MTSERSPAALPSSGLSSLLQSLIEQVLRTDSPRTLLGPRNVNNWVPEALLLPKADVVELSGGATFIDDLERYLGERRQPPFSVATASASRLALPSSEIPQTPSRPRRTRRGT